MYDLTSVVYYRTFTTNACAERVAALKSSTIIDELPRETLVKREPLSARRGDDVELLRKNFTQSRRTIPRDGHFVTFKSRDRRGDKGGDAEEGVQ